MDGPMDQGRTDKVGAEVVEEMVDRLIAILEEHVRQHRKLLEVMEQKKSAMVQVRLDDLEKTVLAERGIIERIADSERERVAATARVAEALGLSTAPLRLLDLIQRVGESHREPLLDLRDELRDVADALDRLNRLNRTLVLHSLEHVHLFLVMLGGNDPQAKIYKKGGGEGAQPASILLDRRI